jgi:hypothetical protein
VTANGDQLAATFKTKGMVVDDAVTSVVYFRRAGAPGDEPFTSLPFLSFNAKLTQDEIKNGFLFTSTPTTCMQPGTYKVEVFAGDQFLKDGSVDVAEGSFGSLTAETTDLSDTGVCRPSAWSTHSLDNLDNGVTDPVGQGVAYHDTNTGGSLIVRLYRPFSSNAALSPPDLLDSINGFAAEDDINTTLTGGQLGDPSEADPVRVTLDDGTQECLPARTATGTAKSVDDGTGEKLEVFAIQGADKVLRVVMVAAPDQKTVDDMVAELVPRITFQRTGATDDGAVACP